MEKVSLLMAFGGGVIKQLSFCTFRTVAIQPPC
jgi:hypothetical protein